MKIKQTLHSLVWVCAVGLILLSSSVFGQVFKCEDARGRRIYSDVPCAVTGEKIRLQPNDFGGPLVQPTTIEPIGQDRTTRGVQAPGTQKALAPMPPSANTAGNIEKDRTSLIGDMSCPLGTHQWVDQWGNKICKRLDTGQTTSIQGSIDSCPMGTHAWVDSWGNKICKSFDNSQEYHDTSKGCSIGTLPWTDILGNRVCKDF